MSDERREFTEEMRAETRTARELEAMAAILDGETCMDRYAAMFDTDDFEGTPRQALEMAIEAEAREDGGDMATVRALASAFIDDTISEFMGGR